MIISFLHLKLFQLINSLKILKQKIVNKGLINIAKLLFRQIIIYNLNSMKRLYTILIAAFLLSTNVLTAQYYYFPNLDAGENPGGLNTDSEPPADLSPWSTVLGPTATTWSSVQSIPFSFDFNGNRVSSYIVSPTGVVTFSTSETVVPSSNNTSLPSTEIPDNSICVWGLTNTGANSGNNDYVYSRTFGNRPNRQHWIWYNSYSSPHAMRNHWGFWAIVLEENTNKIFIVDQRTFHGSFALTVGIQINDTLATQVTGSPNLSGSASNLANSDNGYYEFIQGTLPERDIQTTSVDVIPFPNLTDGPFDVKGTLFSRGANTINSYDLSYTVNGGNVITETVNNLNILPGQTFDFNHGAKFNPTSGGVYNLKIWTSNINGAADFDPTTDTLNASMVVSDTIPNLVDLMVDNFIKDSLFGDRTDGLDDPKDLDFHPDLGRSELWVINHRIESTGGSTVTYANVDKPSQTADARVDGNAWHFMSMPSGIAFSDNGNFANSPSVFDANHSGGPNPFTGPALWSSDLAIYARPSGGNGSHLDMLHESPYAMGIAHESGNAFWVFDGFSSDIVRYDFAEDHGPGNDFHGDATVRRYPVPVRWVNQDVPCHLVLDKTSNWLYIADAGNRRVLRLDITSGTVSGNRPAFAQTEPLVEYSQMTGITWEVVADTGFVQPAGIEIVGNRLLVSDRDNGEIRVFDISGTTVDYVGKISTGRAGMNGIKVGPEGNVWYVNGGSNELRRIAPVATSIKEVSNSNNFSIYPNPSEGQLTILNTAKLNESYTIVINNAMGQVVTEERRFLKQKEEFDLRGMEKGVYFINFIGESERFTKRVVINR